MYLDSSARYVQGVDWDDDITKRLLHSICYVPILFFGTTAPLTQFAKGASTQLVAAGWEAPLGLTRLGGLEQDRKLEDAKQIACLC